MELRLADGTVLSGSATEMHEYLHAQKQEQPVFFSPSLRPEPVTEERGMRSWKETNIYPFYTSSTHGHTLINDMHTLHIKNAILKMHRDDTHLDRPREFEGLVETMAARLTEYETSHVDLNN